MSVSLVKYRSNIATGGRLLARYNASRCLATSSTSEASSSLPAATTSIPENTPSTHFKITLKRSAIALGDKKKDTLLALGLHRRFQTVYHRHTPEAAGKILRVKELVEVENVPDHLVKSKQEMRQDRKAVRGYQVLGSRRDLFAEL